MSTNEVVIKPTTDLFIAALWSAPKNEPILRSLLNAVMTDAGMPSVTKATILNPYNIQEFPVDKQIRLDVLVEDATGAIYNVEVQREAHSGFLNRMVYYWAEIYGSQLKAGESYLKLRPVRSVVIAEFPVFPELERLHTIIELRARERSDVLLSRHCQIHFLRLGDLLRNDLAGLDQFGLDLQRWMQFWVFGSELEEEKMSAMLQDSPAVLQAYEEYKRFSGNPVMREKTKARERFLIDQQLNLNEAREEGEARKARETAVAMKHEGFDAALIARITGLPLSEVEDIVKKKK